MRPHAASQLTPVALSGLAACVLLNLLLRTFLRLPGPLMTLLVALLCALVLRLAFRLTHPNPPTAAERRRLLLIYTAGLSLLYSGLLLMLEAQDPLTPIMLLIYLLHWLCYPLLAWWVLRPAGHR